MTELVKQLAQVQMSQQRRHITLAGGNIGKQCCGTLVILAFGVDVPIPDVISPGPFRRLAVPADCVDVQISQ
ncbi:hypothetical protein D3C80_1977380 [compost metagenome]